MRTQTCRLRAVLIPDGPLWVVQGVEYDIVAQGDDIPGARKAFERMLVERCVIAEHLGKDGPMDGVPPAPDRFRSMFENAEEELSRLKASDYPEAPFITMRLASVE